MRNYNVPEKFRPLSPWEYFGLTILFSIPVIGIICMIVMALSNSNINRRNFARSYFCTLAIAIILIIVLTVTGVLTKMLGA